jgi:hypothetical protein
MDTPNMVEVAPHDRIRITFGGLRDAIAEVTSVADGHGEVTVRVLNPIVVEQGDFELIERASANSGTTRR